MHACFGFISEDAPSLFLRLVGLGAPGHQAGGVSVLLKDTFTDANGTTLGLHTMDVGPGWTELLGTLTIQSNQATSSGQYRVYADAGKADVTISATVTPNAATGFSHVGLLARVTDNGNHWDLYIDVTNGKLVIDEVNAGVFTTRASATYAYATGTAYALQAVLSGQSITLSSTPGPAGPISYGSAALNQTVTKHGLQGQGTPTGTGHQTDNFQVTNP